MVIGKKIDTQVSAVISWSCKVLHNESLIDKLDGKNVVTNYEPPKQGDEPSIEDVENDPKASDRDGNVMVPTAKIPIKITHPFP